MKPTLRHYLSLLRALALLTAVWALCACTEPAPAWHIGVSQCSNDAWRAKLNRELAIAGYANDDIRLDIVCANDNSALQAKQIEGLIADGIDLLFISPNSSDSLRHAIDAAYDAGIPVVLFDRHTDSDKYTAYIGADNYTIGYSMGQYVAQSMGGRGVVAELMGLQSSSAATERHRGFCDALRAYPQIRIVSSQTGGWTMRHGEKAMMEILQQSAQGGREIDCVFGHNDRLALGARHVGMPKGLTRIRYFGIDGLPTPDGGIEAVASGKMVATYIYPTQGLEMISLARSILNHQPFERVNVLESAIVDENNAQLMALQYQEMERASADLEKLNQRVDTYFSRLHLQRCLLAAIIVVTLIILLLALLLYRSLLSKARLHAELSRQHAELSKLYRQLEDMADARLVFFTNVGHRLRTPLTMLVAPLESLLTDRSLPKPAHEMLAMMERNLRQLSALVDSMLRREDMNAGAQPDLQEEDASALMADAAEQGAQLPIVPASASPSESASGGAQQHGERRIILAVDDNADVRTLLRRILEEAGYEVHLAADGKEGYDAARTIVPDLIVSDVMMPVMDGLEMCRRVKGDGVTCHIPLIMLTARTLDAHRVEGYHNGADAYLTKPFSPAILTARIANLLQTRRTLLATFSVARSGEAQALAAGAGQQPAPVSQPAHALPAETRTEETKPDAQPLQPSPRDEQFMKRFASIIQSHLSDAEFGVEDACGEMAMSRVQLYRKVKALTGKTPVEILRQTRVERAREMLLTSDKSISEIAYACGFNAPSYFNKCFKDAYGLTPGELRPNS